MSDSWTLILIIGLFLLPVVLIDAIWRDRQRGWPHSARRTRKDAEELRVRLGAPVKCRVTRSGRA